MILLFESTILKFQNTLIFRVREMKSLKVSRLKRQRLAAAPALCVVSERALNKCSAPFPCLILENISASNIIFINIDHIDHFF